MTKQTMVVGIGALVLLGVVYLVMNKDSEKNIVIDNSEQINPENQDELLNTPNSETASATPQVDERPVEQRLTPVSPKTTVTTSPVKQTVPQTSAITLAENKSGGYVTIASARLVKPGYIVIYRTNSKEQTSLIGYSSLLEANYYTNLSIQLNQPVAREQVITAVLHVDDGDGKYEFPISDTYMTSGSAKILYDEDVVDTPSAEEAGMINGTVEQHLKDAKAAISTD